MNLGELESALNLAVLDKSLVGSFAAWINIALLELAAALDLPALKTMFVMRSLCTRLPKRKYW